MVGFLFQEWSNPAAIAGLVASRTVLNGILTVLVVESVGRNSPHAGGVFGLTVVSTSAMVLVLEYGTFGAYPGYVELLSQLAILAVAGLAVIRYGSPRVTTIYAVAAVCAVALALFSIPIYGEATVAP